jgi:ribosomal protein S18 acetylase RimI-like enzyme
VSGINSQLCPAEERPEALAILYQHLPPDERQAQVEKLLAPEAVRLDGLITCKDKNELLGVVFCMSSPGRVMMMWTPRIALGVTESEKKKVLASLVEAAKNYGRDREARFVQLLGDEPQPPFDVVLDEAGFFLLTQLVYARRPVMSGEYIEPLPQGIELVSYSDDLREELLELLAKSYEGSLDCPELNGIRSMDDIFESHRGENPFDPERWKLVRSKGEWIGCILLSAVEKDRLIEISYVALVPSVRGKGFGRILTREAIRYAANHKYQSVVLAVDSRNSPALGMYEDEGFTPWDVRQVYLSLLDPLSWGGEPSDLDDG